VPMKGGEIKNIMAKFLKTKIIFLIIIFALAAASATPVYAAPTFVRVAAKLSPNDPSSVVNGITYNPMQGQGKIDITGVQAGNFLVVITSLSAAQPTTVTSSTGETWINDIHSTVSQNPGDSLDIFHASDVTGGSKTIYITSPQTRALRAVVLEYSGVAPNSPAHRTSKQSEIHPSGGAPITGSAGSVTTTIPNSLIVVGCRTDSDFMGWSPGSGYTMRTNPNTGSEPDQKVGVEDMVAAAAGTYSGTFTFNSDLFACGMVAYAPSEGGGGATPPAAPAAPSGLTVQ